MTNTETKFSISAAARVTSKSRTTIAAHINAGKLSVNLDNSGNKLIDAAELLQVYGDECDFERTSSASKAATRSQQQQGIESEQGLHSQLHSVQQLLAVQHKERDREREQLQARIDSLEAALQQSQEGHNRATLLLENHTTGVGDWEKTLHNLQQRVATQEEQTQQEPGLSHVQPLEKPR